MNRLNLERIRQMEAEGKIKGWRFNASKSMNRTIRDLVKKAKDQEEGRRNKYGARRVEIDGIWFDSQKEANRYVQLRFLKRMGQITDLELQVPFELNEGGTHSLHYIADFVYTEVKNGQRIVEDAKGFRTREYRKKRKLMKKVYGITIHEV